MRHFASNGTHVALLLRTGQRADLGQLRSDVPSELEMQLDVGQRPDDLQQLPMQTLPGQPLFHTFWHDGSKGLGLSLSESNTVVLVFQRKPPKTHSSW